MSTSAVLERSKEKKQSRVTVGTDPEFFLRNNKTGKFTSAIGIVKGTKDNPEKMPNGSLLQYDNVAIEFATEPAPDIEDFLEKIRNSFLDMYDKIPSNLDIVAEPSVNFELDELMCEEAMKFGCDPDFNAWSLSQNEPPNTDGLTLRSCGGHLHVGHVDGDGCEFLHDIFGKINAVKIMDTFHGIVSVVLDSGDAAHERRQLYGKAGCYRPTDYGVEYRVLSNFWLKSPDYVRLMDSLCQDALNYMKKHSYDFLTDLDSEFDIVKEIQDDVGENGIVNVINNSEVDKAKYIIDKYLATHFSEKTIDLLHTVMQDDDNTTIKKAWRLK